MLPAGPGFPIQHSPNVHADVPSIVHDLIRDMKALEAALHRWGCAQASPEDVSNCYVQFGVEFNAVVHAFESYDIPTSDFHAVPTQLRSALEECLGEEPSFDALDRYMPEIRRLLRKVLLGLRAKHSAWRSATSSSRSHSSGETRLSTGSLSP